jgi:hypothetical protein
MTKNSAIIKGEFDSLINALNQKYFPFIPTVNFHFLPKPQISKKKIRFQTSDIMCHSLISCKKILVDEK